MADVPMNQSQAGPPPPDPTQGLMGMAQGAMNNPVGQPAPTMQGAGPLIAHPVVQKIIQALAQGASAYGWTGASPQERLERTQLQSQKAETLARLAQTGAYQSGELDYRKQLAGVGQQNADTRAGELSRKQDMDAFNQDLKQQEENRKQGDSDINQYVKQGRLDLATQVAKQNLDKFEQSYALAKQKFGDQQARTMMIEQGLGIRQQLANTIGAALDQKGTVAGAQVIAEQAKLRAEHPLTMGLLDSLGMGLPDLGSMVQKAGSAGIPGTTPTSPGATTPAAQPPVSAAPTPPANNKLQAKRNQKNATPPAGGAVTHVWTPNGIQPVGGPQ